MDPQNQPPTHPQGPSREIGRPESAQGTPPSAGAAADSPRLATLRAMLLAEPDDGFVLYGLAQECQKLGRLDEAIGFYDRAIEADPKQCYAYFHKAKALEQARRRPEVAAVLKAGLARARAVGDFKAGSELQAYLDDVEDAP